MYTVKKYANGRVLYKHTSTRKLIMLMICINMHWNVKISQYSIWRKKKIKKKEIIKHHVINNKQYTYYHSNVKKKKLLYKAIRDKWFLDYRDTKKPRTQTTCLSEVKCYIRCGDGWCRSICVFVPGYLVPVNWSYFPFKGSFRSLPGRIIRVVVRNDFRDIVHWG